MKRPLRNTADTKGRDYSEILDTLKRIEIELLHTSDCVKDSQNKINSLSIVIAVLVSILTNIVCMVIDGRIHL